MKICVLGNNFINWGGGLDFLRNIVNALLHQTRIDKLELFILVYEENDIKRDIKNFVKKNIFRREINNWKAREDIVYDFFDNCEKKIEIKYLKGSKNELVKFLVSNEVDFIFPTSYIFDKDFPIKWIGYIYDFQHKYYPEFFTKEEIERRNKYFSKMVESASKIIVNSKDTKRDINKFIPKGKANIYSLPFSPVPIKEWLLDEIDFDFISKKYSLPKTYFLVSNQFWIHKNHRTLFEAIKKLKQNNIDIKIICTGLTKDGRFPNYFEELESYIETNDLNNNIKILGLIPKREQIEIMKKGKALIQPTLFEGGPGGGSVYDAVSLGIPCIVSDIPINKEIEEENIFYFKAGDSNDLSNKLIEFLSLKNIEEKSIDQLLKKGEDRKEYLGNFMIDLLLE